MTAPGDGLARRFLRAGLWAGAADHVVLGHDDRLLRRRRLVLASGASVMVDLAETVGLEAGDALVTEDGRFIEIRAAEEALIAVRAPLGG